MTKGINFFSLTGDDDITVKESHDYFEGLPGFKHISEQIKKRDPLGVIGLDLEHLRESDEIYRQKTNAAWFETLSERPALFDNYENEPPKVQKYLRDTFGFDPESEAERVGELQKRFEAGETLGSPAGPGWTPGGAVDPELENPYAPNMFNLLSAEQEHSIHNIHRGNQWAEENIPHFDKFKWATQPFLWPFREGGTLYAPQSELMSGLVNAETEWDVDLTAREKIWAAGMINENRPWEQQLITGLIVPSNVVGMPLFKSAVGVTKAGVKAIPAITRTAKSSLEIGNITRIVEGVPPVFAKMPKAWNAIKSARADTVSQIFNSPITIPGLADDALFEADLRLWINMPDNAVVDMASFPALVADLGIDATQGGANILAVKNSLDRLVNLNLIGKAPDGSFFKKATPGSPEAREILGDWGNTIGIQGASDTALVVSPPSIKSVVDTIITLETPIMRFVAKGLGINPSAAAMTGIEKLVLAGARVRGMTGELAEIALQVGLDVHMSKWLKNPVSAVVGPERIPMPNWGKIPVSVDKDGIVKDTGYHWMDVFANPKAFKQFLSDAGLEYIEWYNKINNQMENLRIAHGLNPLSVDRDGLYYVPRITISIDELNLLKKSNYHKERQYEYATDALMGTWDEKAGKFIDRVTYEIDPRANLKIHIQATYDEIIRKDMGEELIASGLGLTRKEIIKKINPKVYTEFVDQFNVYKAAKDKVKQLRLQLPSAYTATTKATLNKALADAEKVMQTAWKNLRQKKNAYVVAKRKITEDGILPESLWGDTVTTGNIDIGVWRNRIYKLDDYEALENGIGKLIGDTNTFIKVMGNYGNTVRWLSANVDWGAPLIHGFPTLTRHPWIWTKATIKHFQAWLDPAVQARFVAGRIKTFHKMATNGVPVGDIEMFAAMKSGQGIPFGAPFTFVPDKVGGKILGHVIGEGAESPTGLELSHLDRILLGVGKTGKAASGASQEAVNQSFGRFQSSYNMLLTMSRALVWESLEETFTTSTRSGNTLEELGAYIRNLTGALDTAALGVGKNQRSLEGFWMAFSPRLFRSTVALVSDAIRFAVAETAGRAMGGTGASVRQTQSAKTIANVITAVHGLYLTAAIANGVQQGHSVERIRDDIRVSMNPTSGKKYLSVLIDGQWYGVGGQIRALTQLLGGLISTLAPGGQKIKDMLTLHSDNPFVQFMGSRGAVGVTSAQTIAEGIGGRQGDPDDPEMQWSKFDTLKFDNVDSVPDIIYHSAVGSAPFVAQGLMEGDTAPGAVAGAGGLRSSPMTPGDEAMEMIKDAYYQMSPEELAEYGHSKGEWVGNLSPSDLWDFTTADGFPRHKKDISSALLNKIMLDNPEIREALNRQAEELKESGSQSGIYKIQKQEDRTKRDDAIFTSLQEKGVGWQLRDAIQNNFKEYALDSRETETRHEGMIAEWEEGDEINNAFNRALDGYWEFMTLDQDGSHPPMIDSTSREYNFNERDRRIKVLENDPDIGPHMGHIEDLKYASAKPEVRILLKEYDNDIDLIRPYWELRDDLIASKNFEDKWLIYTKDPHAIANKDAYKKGAVPDTGWTDQDAKNAGIIETIVRNSQEELLKGTGKYKDKKTEGAITTLLLVKWGYKSPGSATGLAKTLITSIKIKNGPIIGSATLNPETLREDINEAIRTLDPTYFQEFQPQLTR